MRLFILFVILIFAFGAFAQNKNVALKFDEFDIPQDKDGGYTVFTSDEIYEKGIDYHRVVRFAQEVLKYKDSKAYIIFYNQRKGRYPLNKGEKERESIVSILIREKLLLPEQIVVIEGGYRKDATFEFWIVPLNAEPPKPTPTFSPLEIAVCPSIFISRGYSEFHKDRNQPLNFSVNVFGAEPNAKLNLEWNVSAGKITKGQNTNQIEVDVSETKATFISASVTVRGLHPECDNHKSTFVQVGVFRYNYSASYSSYVSHKIKDIDEDDYRWLRNMIDAFMNEILADPTSKGYIFIYGSRNGGKEKSSEAIKTINDHLKLRDFFDKTRIAIADGGYREEVMIEFSVVPASEPPPKPTPTLDAQFIVEPKKIVKKQPKTKK